MGYSKNYIMYWGGYEYYNTITYPEMLFPKFTNITICMFTFWYICTKSHRDNYYISICEFVQ